MRQKHNRAATARPSPRRTLSHAAPASSAFRRGDDKLAPDVFQKFQELVYRESGIWLAPHKMTLLIARLAKRLRQLGIPSMAEYLGVLMQPDQARERDTMIDCITTNETRFFREQRHFEFLAQDVIPRWKEECAQGKRAPRIRIWSAGCSTGEEPYSIAMMLINHFGEDSGWDLSILATDISTCVLEKARTGVFPLSRHADIPTSYLQEYMLRGTHEQDGYIKISPAIQRLVSFSRVNVQADSLNVAGEFDLIFCRNVMIYFDENSKKKALAGLLQHLCPTGYLLIGHSENLHGLSVELKSIIPTVYAFDTTSELINK